METRTQMASMQYLQDPGNNRGTPTKDFSTMRLGIGWKLTAQEMAMEVAVTDQSSTTTYLVYNDSDGTEHYFKQSSSDSSKYEDEDGLNLTITKSGSNYTMTDKKDNVKTFTSGYHEY